MLSRGVHERGSHFEKGASQTGVLSYEDFDGQVSGDTVQMHISHVSGK